MEERFRELFAATREYEPGDQTYESYVRFNLGAVDRGRVLVQKLSSRVNVEGARVLDIGAGSGGLTIAFAEAGAHVTAVEPYPRRYGWAQARLADHGADAVLTRDVAERLPFGSNTFDLAILDSVIEHVDDPAAAIREVCRVLRPRGVVYCVSPNKSSLLNVLRDPHYGMVGVVLMPRRVGAWYVERVRGVRRGYWVNVIPSRRWLARQFRENGVTIERLEPTGLEKLSEPSLITRHVWVRRVAHLANSLRLIALMHDAVVAQFPVHELLGTKR